MYDESEGGERRKREGEEREEERKGGKKREKRGKTWCFSPAGGASTYGIDFLKFKFWHAEDSFLDTQSLATMCTVLQVPKKRKGFKATVSLEEMESQK